MKNTFVFAPDAITVNGHRFTAEYIPAADGNTMTIFVTLDADDHDKDAIINVAADDPRYAAVMAAANGETAQPLEAASEAPATPVEPEPQAEAKTAESDTKPEKPSEAAPNEAPAESPAEEVKPGPKQAHGPVPEKTFIGTRIDGAGYSIFFNGETGRTQIQFTSDANNRMMEAAAAAGFYYSKATGTYNRKLTFRAYRAAVALAEQFNAA